MRYLFVLLAVLSGAMVQAADRPNILFIMSDDHTTQAIGAYGSQLAALAAFGLDVSYINDYGAALMSAETEMVAAVIDEVFPSADDLVFVLLGDAEQIREQVSKYGPLIEMPITEPHFRPPAPAEE